MQSIPFGERDIPAQTRAYLRVLYSARLGRRLEQAVRRGRTLSAELEFARSLDFAQLAIEQQARVRNLSHSLRRSCQFLAEATSPEQFRALVAAYAEHALFWRARGRSLGENFCLFAYQALHAAGAAWQAEVARLDGVSFGVAAQAATPTPWQSYLGLAHEAGVGAERYHSRTRLLDDSGRLLSESAALFAECWVQISSDGAQLHTEVQPC